MTGFPPPPFSALGLKIMLLTMSMNYVQSFQRCVNKQRRGEDVSRGRLISVTVTISLKWFLDTCVSCIWRVCHQPAGAWTELLLQATTHPHAPETKCIFDIQMLLTRHTCEYCV